MKKIRTLLPGNRCFYLTKLLIFMKLTTFLHLISFTCIAATGYSQPEKVTIQLKDASTKDFFNSIENQTSYKFLYRDDAVENIRVNLDEVDMPLDKVLNQVLNGSQFGYKILANNLIAIAPVEVFQQIKVTGTVTDENGNPLPGVNVQFEGTIVGTITDNNGKFSLTKPDENAVLMFSFMGYNTQKVSTSGKSVVDIKMVPNVTSLEEVVVVGYGTQKKSDLTGSVTAVTPKEFANQVVVSPTSALQGRTAGVIITNNSGAPGGETKIRIRGANSILGGNNPLYVIDGMYGSPDNINTNDIESIEILKDASATAIYGSMGANGVVLITTKRGRTEKLKVDFSSSLGMSQIAHKYDLMDPVTYAENCNIKTPNTYSEAYIDALRTGGGTDWQNEIFKTGQSQDYQLSISGGTQKLKYYISGRYLDQTGIVLNSDFKKYSIGTNIQGELSKRLTIDAKVMLNRSEGFNNQSTGGQNSPIQQSILWGPAEHVYNADGSYQEFDYIGGIGKNPVAVLKTAYMKTIPSNVMANTKLSYKITDFLTLDVLAGLDASFGETDYVNSKYSIYGTPSSYRSQGTSMSMQNSNILTFHKNFGNVHDLTVTGVYEQSKGYSDGFGVGGGLTYPALMYYSLQSNTGLTASSNYSMSALRSWVGRVNYSLLNKYLFTATYRADGSTKFPNHHWGFFPSFALGWKASEEEFIKDLNLFSNLKLRGSWGLSGNQAVNAFATVPQMSSGIYGYGQPNASTIFYNVYNHLGDANLKWESTRQVDMGADMGFLKNRLSVSIDYFNKKTNNLLLNVPIPYDQGGYTWDGSVGYVLRNVGSVQNKGVEFMITAVPVDTKEITWSVNFNISSYKNKVTDLGKDKYITVGASGSGITFSRVIVGQPLGTFYGYKFMGIYQENEAAEAALYGLNPGDSKYLDKKKDNVIDSEDEMVIGHANPDYCWGLNNTVRFRNFELNLFLQAVHGNSVIDVDYAAACTGSVYGINRKITSANVTPWTSENKSNMWPKLSSTSNIEYANCSKWVQDGSFVRLKNLSVGYYVPENAIKGASVKVILSAQNLLTFTKYKGFDPEASTSVYDNAADTGNGIVMGAYPSARTFLFTIQLSL